MQAMEKLAWINQWVRKRELGQPLPDSGPTSLDEGPLGSGFTATEV